MKEFFKITIGKIILTVLLILMIITIYFIQDKTNINLLGIGLERTVVCYDTCKIARPIILFFIFPLNSFFSIINLPHYTSKGVSYLLFFGFMLVQIFWLYLISCLIIYIYNKIKKRNS